MGELSRTPGDESVRALRCQHADELPAFAITAVPFGGVSGAIEICDSCAAALRAALPGVSTTPVLSVEMSVTAWKRDAAGGSATLSSPRWVTHADPERIELVCVGVRPPLLAILSDTVQRWRVTLTPAD